MDFPNPPSIAYDFGDTQPHTFVLEYSHSGDASGGGLTLKWEAPAQPQIDEALAAAKQADVVVAFVGLSPHLEGEEMRIKIDGFSGGDRTSLALPAAQEKLLQAVAATGKPLIVVLQSGSAVALELGQRSRERSGCGLVSGSGGGHGDSPHARWNEQSRRPVAGDFLCER